MYPTRLNLLSKRKRKRLQLLVYAQFIKNTLESLLIFLCLIGMTLLATEWVLQSHFNDLIGSFNTSNSERASHNKEIKSNNRVIERLDLLQKNYMQWTTQLQALSESMPTGITLSGMQLDIRARTGLFSGIAATRDDLLKFETALESLAFVEDINVPLSELT